jgi:hypothetical protein
MAKVKLNIRGLSTTEKVAKARQIIKALTDNAAFTTPQPPLATIATAANELEAAHGDAQTARQTAVTKTSIMHEKEDALEALLRQLGGYIESVAGDDESKILSAGISIRTTTPVTQTLETPIAPSATEGDHDGEIDLSWDTVKGAKSYVIERSPDPPTATSWVHEAVSLKSSATVSGLVSGTRYWFRVAAVMSSGQSGWSDPGTKIAP